MVEIQYEIYSFKEDLMLICQRAGSFPEGVMEAHHKLHSIISHEPERKYYSVSYFNDKAQVVYLAATNRLATDHTDALDLEKFVVKKGNFASKRIENYRENLGLIKEAFEQLVKLPNIAKDGFGLEYYESQTVVFCMVPITNA